MLVIRTFRHSQLCFCLLLSQKFCGGQRILNIVWEWCWYCFSSSKETPVQTIRLAANHQKHSHGHIEYSERQIENEWEREIGLLTINSEDLFNLSTGRWDIWKDNWIETRMSILFRDFTNDDYIGTCSATLMHANQIIIGGNTAVYSLWPMKRYTASGQKRCGIPGKAKLSDQALSVKTFSIR